VNTITPSRARIQLKTGINTTAELIRYALQTRLVE
jgi:hypothetical protein